jgi:cytochrome c553
MQTNVATLSDRDMRDIADFFASRKPVPGSFSLDAAKVARGRSRAEELKCAACHMPDFSGKKEVPRLAGLDPNYIGPQIVAFTAGKRPHPPVDGMSGISGEDAESLAQYLAQLE